MNLISGTHHEYEMREYAFMVLQEYTIISQLWVVEKKLIHVKVLNSYHHLSYKISCVNCDQKNKNNKNKNGPRKLVHTAWSIASANLHS